MPASPAKPSTVIIATRGSRRLHRQIAALARAENRTISGYLRLLLTRVVREETKRLNGHAEDAA